MADNYLERQYEAFLEKKAGQNKKQKAKKPSVKFYTRVPKAPEPKENE